MGSGCIRRKEGRKEEDGFRLYKKEGRKEEDGFRLNEIEEW